MLRCGQGARFACATLFLRAAKIVVIAGSPCTGSTFLGTHRKRLFFQHIPVIPLCLDVYYRCSALQQEQFPDLDQRLVIDFRALVAAGFLHDLVPDLRRTVAYPFPDSYAGGSWRAEYISILFARRVQRDGKDFACRFDIVIVVDRDFDSAAARSGADFEGSACDVRIIRFVRILRSRPHVHAECVMQHDGGFHGRTGHNVQHHRGSFLRSECVRLKRHHGLRALDHCLEGLHSRQSARIAGGDLYLCGALRYPFHRNDIARHGDRGYVGVQRRGFVREFVVIRIAEPGRGVYLDRLACVDHLGRDHAHCLRRLIDLIDRYADFLGGRQPVRVPGGYRYRHGLLRCRCDRDRTSRCLGGDRPVSVQFLDCADRGVFFHVKVPGRSARRVHREGLGRNRPRLLGRRSDRDRTT